MASSSAEESNTNLQLLSIDLDGEQDNDMKGESKGVDTPILLGKATDEAISDTTTEIEMNVGGKDSSPSTPRASYGTSYDRSRKTYKDRTLTLSKKKQITRERLKNTVSPGALRQLSQQQSKELKWSMQKRMDVIAGLDLKRLSSSYTSKFRSSEEYTDPRRTLKVAVRVREFTNREVKAQAKRAISVDKDRISIVKNSVFTDADAETVATAAQFYGNHEWASNFTFDKCFFSQASGHLKHNDGSEDLRKGTDTGQMEVFDEIGSELVENVLNGFSSSCFAYGHQGSGKSYTMFGKSDGEKNSLGICQKSDGAVTLLKTTGLIPRVMTQIVTSIRKAKDTCDDTTISLSFAEIHNDRAFDLLSSPSSHREPEHSSEDDHRRERTSLKLREHPSTGPYVEGLVSCTIRTPADVLRYLEEGLRRRAEAARVGPRGHCIVTLELSPSKAFLQAHLQQKRASRLSPHDKNNGRASGMESPKESPSTPRGQNTGHSTPLAPNESISNTVATNDEKSSRSSSPIPSPTSSADSMADIVPVKLHMVDLCDALAEGSSSTPMHTNDSMGNSGVVGQIDNHGHEMAMRRSLSTLGAVMRGLGGNNGTTMLPFRDCGLTWLLRDVLTSPGHTAFIANVSPVDTCYEETLHTLKFASQLRPTSAQKNSTQICADSSNMTTTATEESAISATGGNDLPTMSSYRATGGRNSTISDEADYDSINPGVRMSQLSSATKDTLSDLADYNKALERVQAGLGANKPGSVAARTLLQATISDPRQTLSNTIQKVRRQAPSGQPVSASKHDYTPPSHQSNLRSHLEGITEPERPEMQSDHSPTSFTLAKMDKERGSPSFNNGSVSPALIAIGDIGTRSLDTMREKFSRLKAEYIELEIELDQCRTDRDSVCLHLQMATNKIANLEKRREPSPRSKETLATLNTRLETAKGELHQLTQVVNAKEDAIERLYDEVKAERDQRNSVECEADRVVAILRGQIDVLEQQLAIQNKQQAEDSEGKKAGSGGQLEGATPLGADMTEGGAMLEYLSEQLVQVRLQLEARDAEVFQLNERIAEIAAGVHHERGSALTSVRQSRANSASSEDVPADTVDATGEGVGLNNTEKVEELPLAVTNQLSEDGKQELDRAALVLALEEEQALHTAALQEVTLLTTRLRAATSQPPVSPTPTIVGSTESKLGDAERGSLQKMIDTQDQALQRGEEQRQALEQELQSLQRQHAEDLSSMQAKHEDQLSALGSEKDVKICEQSQAIHKLEAETAHLKARETDLQQELEGMRACIEELQLAQSREGSRMQDLEKSIQLAENARRAVEEENDTISRVIKTQEATIKLLEQQQTQHQASLHSNTAPETAEIPKIEQDDALAETRAEKADLEKKLEYYTTLCTKQKEYIARIEASTTALIASSKTILPSDVANIPPAPHSLNEVAPASSISLSQQQYSLVLEKLSAAEAKAQYWQELAQKSGAKNASNFLHSPVVSKAVSGPHTPLSSPASLSNIASRNGLGSRVEKPMVSSSQFSPGLRNKNKREDALDNLTITEIVKGEVDTLPDDSAESVVAVGAKADVPPTREQLQELSDLRRRLAEATEEKEKMQREMSDARHSMKKEYTSLWVAVQDLNRLDESKEKAIDALLEDKVKSEKKLSKAQRQYQKLHDELSALDSDLLSTARQEGLLSSIRPDTTPILAKKIQFNPEAAVYASEKDGDPARGDQGSRIHIHPQSQLLPHYLQTTIATEGWVRQRGQPSPEVEGDGFGAAAVQRARSRSKSPSWRPPGVRAPASSHNSTSIDTSQSRHAPPRLRNQGNNQQDVSFDSQYSSAATSDIATVYQAQATAITDMPKWAAHSPPHGLTPRSRVLINPEAHPRLGMSSSPSHTRKTSANNLAPRPSQSHSSVGNSTGTFVMESEAERELRESLSELDDRLHRRR